jgi:terminase large subunit-like protein
MQKTEFTVQLPNLFPLQIDIRKHSAQRKVINAGRRGGKTTLAANIAVERMLDGKRVIYAAPVAKQTDAFWKKCKRYLREGIAIGKVGKNDSNRLLTLGRGEISCQTAHDADTMRSGEADLLILDEWALMNVDAWDKVGAPMLTDSNGDALFISTPRRKNHHFRFYQRGVGDGETWASFHYPSHANPHLSVEALEELVSDMTEDAYRQEILAEFLESEGAVFRNIDACMGAEPSEPTAHKGHNVLAGVDWGKQNDFTAISVGCTTCRRELEIDRFNQIDYAFQRGRLQVLSERWRVGYILAETNAMGAPIIEQLQRDGLPVGGFDTTAQSKPPLIENLALAFERADWQFLPDPIARGELEAYERKVSGNTGRSSYSAPEGLHDDTVIARALMVRAWTDQPRILFGV